MFYIKQSFITVERRWLWVTAPFGLGGLVYVFGKRKNISADSTQLAKDWQVSSGALVCYIGAFSLLY